MKTHGKTVGFSLFWHNFTQTVHRFVIIYILEVNDYEFIKSKKE